LLIGQGLHTGVRRKDASLTERRGSLRLVEFSPPALRGRDAVSVIVVNHNAGKLLGDCVESTLSQACEVIVIDNASDDGSVEAVTVIAGASARLNVTSNSQNIGFSAACNQGARLATGDFLLFLNPDCVPSSDALDEMLEVMERNPEAGMVGGFLCNPDGTEQAGGRRSVPTPWRSFVRAFGLTTLRDRWPRLFDGFDLSAKPLPDHPVEVEAISGACMLVRREAYCQVGPLDEGYFMHCEDLDWCMRFRQKDWKVIFVPDAKVVHHLGVCSRGRPYFVEWHKHRGMVRFYRKFFSHQYPGPLLFAVIGAVWTRFLGIVLMIHAKRLLGRW